MNSIGRNIEIKYPSYDFKLLTAKADANGYNLNIMGNRRSFGKELDSFNGHVELPDFRDFRQCMIGSGLVQYTNMDQFKEKLDVKQKSLCAGESIYFSFDTNMLYNRFFSNYNLFRAKKIILVKTVIAEIKNRLGHKYSSKEISELKMIAKYQRSYFDELINRKKKDSRFAANFALKEYLSISSKIEEIKGIKDPAKSSRENDQIIVDTLSDLGEKKKRVKVILLSSDKDIVDICRIDGVDFFLFVFPDEPKPRHCSAKQFSKFICNLAGAFGFVRVNHVMVFGEFKGKSDNRPDELKLLFFNEKIANEFKRDLQICRRLEELKLKD